MKSVLAVLAMHLCLVAVSGAAQHSKLWGADGSKWDPSGRLPDVSHAGYACGEREIPKPPVKASVRDYGAKGDGITDDTAAFLKAIANAPGGALAIPAGRYRIEKILEIKRPGLVLRGAGMGKTTLVCKVPLNDIVPNWGETTSGQRTSNYSWSGGIVWFKGDDRAKLLGTCKVPANRGARQLRLEGDAKSLKAGTWIEIRVKDDDQRSLLDHLYSGDPGNVSKIKAGKHSTSFVTRVTGVKDGLLALDRPLRIDIRPEWKPKVYLYQPDVTNSGIEELSFEFPERTYGGHFSELGFNAVAFNGVAHCWARNLELINADSGIFAAGRFCTIEGLHFKIRNVTENRGEFGHHGVTLSGHDNLLTRFSIAQRFIHDISVEGGAGNVASAGSGWDLCFDHHKRAPYENVFTDIDAGEGSRLWKCGGGANLGRHCAARGTFWNIRSKQDQNHPGDFGPASMNLVAVQSLEKSLTHEAGRWMEVIDPDQIIPTNLHEAQRSKRLKAKAPVP